MNAKMIQTLRVLRAAKVGEPTIMTSDRRQVLAELLARGLVERTGERAGSVLNKLTAAGKVELEVLEKKIGKTVIDYPLRSAVRRTSK